MPFFALPVLFFEENALLGHQREKYPQHQVASSNAQKMPRKNCTKEHEHSTMIFRLFAVIFASALYLALASGPGFEARY